jgi:hypothetical protein
LSSHPLSKNTKITINLAAVLYGCENWSLTLKEEHRLRAFEKRVLRRIFGSRRKRQQAGENCIMRSFITCMLNKSRSMRWAGYVACMGDVRNAYNILVGKPEGKRPLGRPGCRWEER